MNNLPETRLSFQDAAEYLSDSMRKQFASKKHSLPLMRVSTGIDATDPLLWLFAQQATQPVYWCSRDRREEMAGAGTCVHIECKDTKKVSDQLAHVTGYACAMESGIRMYGGLTFPRVDTAGTAKNTFSFSIPHLELVRKSDKYTLSLNFKSDDNPEDLVRLIRNSLLKTGSMNISLPLGNILKKIDYPDRTSWKSIFTRALELIRKEELDKIVLAKQTILELDHDIRAIDLLSVLRDQAQNCVIFCRQSSNEELFLGASPEMLFRSSRSKVWTEAIAGTVENSTNSDECHERSAWLRTSQKENLEHRIVVDFLRCQLDQVCHTVQFDRHPSLLHLATLQHLVTRFEGSLSNGYHEDTLLHLLHPTPATAGIPRNKALMRITELEPFSRDWYAGAFGWVTNDQSEFAVAIRSGLLSKRKLTLFSGAGIVAGSDEQKEWDEIERKVHPFLKLFTLHTQTAKE